MRTRLERLLAIEKDIRSERYPSVEDLCRTYSVKTRTVYADINILRERLGLEIEFDRTRNGYFNAAPGSTLPSFDLSSEEYLLLICSCETLSASLGSPMKPVLDGILEKIRERLPSGRLIDKTLVKELIRCSANEKSELSAVVFLDVMRACFKRVAIELTCNAPDGDPKAFVFEPHKLIESDKVWHLAGRERGTDIDSQILLTDIIELRFVDSTNGDHVDVD